MQKVFGIGFHKTGTSSLDAALKVLGYRVCGAVGVYNAESARNFRELTAQLSHDYDAFQDNPWPLVYREMDDMWPDAKFILTTRDEEDWYKSVLKYFGEDVTPMREVIYGAGRGSPVENKDVYIERMRKHNEAVRSYFASDPEKLLEIDITRGEGWDKICRFLDLPVPDVDFPHSNKAKTLFQRGKKKLMRLSSAIGGSR